MIRFAALLTLFPLLAASPAAACPDTVVISRGDTLSAIASNCGINVEALMHANPGLRPNRLQPGMIVNVPVAALPSAQRPYGGARITVAPPIATPSPGIRTPTNIPRREYRRELPIYIDPTRQPLPGQMPLPGQPGSPGYPLPLR
jgi:LysM repeat protein